MQGVRATSEFWVSALRKRLETEGIPILVTQKGNREAGAILIRVSNLQGRSKIFIQTTNLGSERRWMEIMQDADFEIDSYLKKQKKCDKEIWILEIEKFNDLDFLNKFILLV